MARPKWIRPSGISSVPALAGTLLAFSVGNEGQILERSEFRSEQLVALVGGLVTSTLLNLLVLPPLFAKFGHRNPPQADRADSQIRS